MVLKNRPGVVILYLESCLCFPRKNTQKKIYWANLCLKILRRMDLASLFWNFSSMFCRFYHRWISLLSFEKFTMDGFLFSVLKNLPWMDFLFMVIIPWNNVPMVSENSHFYIWFYLMLRHIEHILPYAQDILSTFELAVKPIFRISSSVK